MEAYEGLGLHVIGVDASEKFFKDLEGLTDPEQKRKILVVILLRFSMLKQRRLLMQNGWLREQSILIV